MGKSYPDRTNASGIWKINDIYKTWLRWYDYNKEIVVAYAMIAGITLIVGTVGFVIGALVY